jgi:uncharacterized protein (DUF427 family)
MAITDTKMRAVLNGVVVAESADTIVIEGNHYFPETSVRGDLLKESDTTSHCPWKGEARYKTVTVEGATAEDGMWYYPEPLPAATEIQGRVAFWHGVVVEPAT